MTPAEYITAAMRTHVTPSFVKVKEGTITAGLEAQRLERLLHASLGMNTEQAEFADALKKNLVYGKPLDRVNLIEEIGDVFWYCALACMALDVTFEEVFDRNISKLTKRFPDKFTEHAALNRDLAAERAALED